MIDFIKTTFCDQDGKPSSKRITFFVAVIMMIQMTIADQYFGKAIHQNVYDSWDLIVISCCGFVGIEKYISIFKGK